MKKHSENFNKERKNPAVVFLSRQTHQRGSTVGVRESTDCETRLRDQRSSPRQGSKAKNKATFRGPGDNIKQNNMHDRGLRRKSKRQKTYLKK